MRFKPVEKRCSTLVFIREGLRWCCKEMFIRRHFYTFNQLVLNQFILHWLNRTCVLLREAL